MQRQSVGVKTRDSQLVHRQSVGVKTGVSIVPEIKTAEPVETRMEKKTTDESDHASGTSGHPISSLLTTADTGRKSSSSLPEIVLTVREPIIPASELREGLGAVGGGGA